jgi:hypothetical protein
MTPEQLKNRFRFWLVLWCVGVAMIACAATLHWLADQLPK